MRLSYKQVYRVIFATSILWISSCAHLGKSDSDAPTLYAKLGGSQGVSRLVDQLIKNIGSDQQIFHYFAESNVTHFRRGLELHFCSISDGPCTYDGDSMQDIHSGMHINEADFNHLVELLVNAMQTLDYSTSTQNQLLSRLAPLRGEVIKI